MKYIKLELNEKAQMGDEIFDGSDWSKIKFIGKKLSWINPFCEYRRLIG